MMRFAILFAALTLASPSSAFVCIFQTECYEEQACAPSAFELEVQLENQSVSTEAGDWIIVAKKSEPALITLFAAAKGTEYLFPSRPRLHALADISTLDHKQSSILALVKEPSKWTF